MFQNKSLFLQVLEKLERFKRLEILHKIIIKRNLNKYLKAFWETFSTQ